MTAPTPELRFDNRVAVITGAGRGLGRAYALLLAAKGAKVVVNDLGGSMAGDGTDAGPAEEVVAEIRQAGGEAIANTDSVATAQGGQAIIEAAFQQWGRLDILIHNAGNVRRAPLMQMSHEDFNAVIDVHLQGAFNLLRAAFGRMCEAGYGRIILTSSVAGFYSDPNVANYAAAKTAMIGLCNTAAHEGLEKGVKCNLIAPGAVTRMAEGRDVSQYPPMGPELVAPLVAWLAHENCSVTGEYLSAMAGRLSRIYVAETPGIYRPAWTLEQVDADIAAIRDDSKTPWVFPPVPGGQGGHILRSFEAARKGSTD